MPHSPLHYCIEGTGPKVILLHPVGLDLTFFDPLVAKLGSQFQILRMDQQGHGRSPTTEGTRSLSDYARDIHNLLSDIAFRPAAIVGFSFGGMLAQTVALEYPADASELVIAACPSTLTAASRWVMAERGALAEREGMAAVVEDTMERWFTPTFRASPASAPVRRRLLTDNVRGWAQAWSAIAQIDTASRLASIRAPALCLAGGSDRSAPPHVVEAIAKGISGADFEIIPGAPHMLFIEQPHAVAIAIASFLAKAAM